MKTFHLTRARLKDFGACDGALKLFRRRFPNGLEITDDQEANFELLQPWIWYEPLGWGSNNDPYEANAIYAHCAEFEVALDARWLASRLFTPNDPHDDISSFRCDLYTAAGVLADAVRSWLKAEEERALNTARGW